MQWKKYKRRTYTEMRPWDPGADARYPGHPGDMMARDEANHEDEWLVADAFFKANYYLVPE